MMTMERNAMGLTGMNMPMMPGMPNMGMPGTMPGMNMMMMPRCTMMMEKCEGGMTMMCRTDDMMAAQMMQSMCQMMEGMGCSCCCMMNGMPVCCCTMMMADCKCEMMDDGVKMTCTSGDMKMAQMIQSCCDCMMSMMQAGCMCCVMMGNMPICCAAM
jgi:hypothetical protein